MGKCFVSSRTDSSGSRHDGKAQQAARACGGGFGHRRFLFVADRGHERAARIETAPGGHGERRRHRALDRAQPVLARFQRRNGAQQTLRVRMLWARRTTCGPGAVSTILPAYITATSSTRSAITPRSCVIKMTARPRSPRSLRNRSRICAWIVTSSAVVGSSAISNFGSQASAMAMTARCRMPPDN